MFTHRENYTKKELINDLEKIKTRFPEMVISEEMVKGTLALASDLCLDATWGDGNSACALKNLSICDPT